MRSSIALAALCVASSSSGSYADPLLLTPLIQEGKLDEAKKLAEVKIDGQSLGYSGYFSVKSASGKNTNNLFFWYQPCTAGCDPAKAELVQWFQGGPGAPSMYGAIGEIGNTFVDADGKLQERCYSWCKDRNCLFVDSPVQTGFSYQVNSTGQFPGSDSIEYVTSSEDAMEQVYGLLTQFLTIFPELQPAPYWVTGESYGGNYVAWMAKVVLRHNAMANSAIKINLKGVSVGDPILDLEAQALTYANTLYSMGLLMLDEREQVAAIMEAANQALAKGDCAEGFGHWNKIWNDDNSGTEFLFHKFSGSKMTSNALLGDDGSSGLLKMDFSDYMKAHSDAFHFSGMPGTAQTDEGGAIYTTLVKSGDFCQKSALIYLKELFAEANLDVNIYSSNMDPLLGPPTTEAGIRTGLTAIDKLDAFYKQPKTIFHTSSSEVAPAGYARCLPGSAGNRFCYSIIRNAGHTTPAFTPASAYDMTKRFFEGRPFDKTWFDDKPLACAACGGVAPFAGDSLPSCSCPKLAGPPSFVV